VSATERLTEQAVVEDAEGPEPRRRVRGHVRVFQNWCKGCGLCIAFCPYKVFTEDAEHHPVVAYPDRCTACQWCAIHCPDFAIVVEVVDDSERGAGK
jgi:2-oxoglutarate ferredoxin oxidoreductase subunit delta